MKCRECDHAKRGYFKSKPNDYVCIGVKEPFIINDYPNAECTEYPDKPKKKYITHSEITVKEALECLDNFCPVKIIINGCVVFNYYDDEKCVASIEDFNECLVTGLHVDIVCFHHSIISIACGKGE